MTVLAGALEVCWGEVVGVVGLGGSTVLAVVGGVAAAATDEDEPEAWAAGVVGLWSGAELLAVELFGAEVTSGELACLVDVLGT